MLDFIDKMSEAGFPIMQFLRVLLGAEAKLTRDLLLQGRPRDARLIDIPALTYMTKKIIPLIQ
jgi:hypothetical protein